MRKISTHFILTLISLFLPFSLVAQTSYTWTGSTNSNWSTDANWSPAGVPGSTDIVTIPASGTINRPTLTSDVVVYQLTLSGEIDMNGKKMDAQGGGFIINNATVKNSSTGTTSEFSGENHESSESFRIDGSTFEGNMRFRMLSDLAQYEAYSAANHYKGDVEFIFAHKLPRPTVFTNPSICKNYASVFEKKLLISLKDFGEITEFAIADGGIVFSGSSDGEISCVYANWPTFGIGPVTLVIKDATLRKTGTGNIIFTDDWYNIIHISNSLTFDGGVIDNGYGLGSVTFWDNATHSGANDESHIKGRVYKIGDDAFTFPTGSGTRYVPVSITAPANVTDAFSAEYIDSSPTAKGYNTETKVASLSTVYDGGFWDVKRIQGSSDVSLTLGYNVPSGVVTNQNQLRVAHWSGSIWESLGNGGTSGSLTVGTVSTASEVSTFSPFTIGLFAPLPVTLTSLSVKNENQMAHLKWTTTDEKNSSLFEIEHSADAKQWKKIGERNAAGESKSLVHYDYLHTSPLNGLNYYRLKMIDSDGSFAFSRIENLKLSTELKTKVYPNPVANRLFIETTNEEPLRKIEIHGVNGVSMLTADKNDSKNGIDLSGLSNGIYFLEMVKNTGQNEIHKILVHK